MVSYFSCICSFFQSNIVKPDTLQTHHSPIFQQHVSLMAAMQGKYDMRQIVSFYLPTTGLYIHTTHNQVQICAFVFPHLLPSNTIYVCLCVYLFLIVIYIGCSIIVSETCGLGLCCVLLQRLLLVTAELAHNKDI